MKAPMTDEELKSLRWFSEHEPAAGLDVTYPPLVIFPTAKMRDRLVAMGMLEKESQNGLYVFRVTETGRAAVTNGERA